MKKCVKCQQDKSLDKFNKKKSSKDGISSYCKTCQKKYWKEYYENQDNKKKHIKRTSERNILIKKQNGINLYKWFQKHPCVDCGETDPVVLEADHVDENKRLEVSTMVAQAWSWDTIRKELSKCQSRCANCHRRKTALQMGHYKYIKGL